MLALIGSVSVHIDHNGQATDDGNGVYLNADGTVTIQCVSNAPIIQWTSSGNDSFTSTNTSITVNASATYTCTASVCQPSTARSINVQGTIDLSTFVYLLMLLVSVEECISEYRFCYLVPKYDLCHLMSKGKCCISCP